MPRWKHLLMTVLAVALAAGLLWFVTQDPSTTSQSVTRQGLIALNVERSSYAPGDTVTIGMAFVNSVGETVCDGNVAVHVLDAHGAEERTLSTADGTIVPSGECSERKSTNVSDYTATFNPAGSGTYTLQLVALDDGMPLIAEKTFMVTNDVQPFVIERKGAMRLYPQETYQMQLTVRAAKEYSGTVSEELPARFSLKNISTGGVLEPPQHGQSLQHIAWQVHIPAGGSTQLTYSYDAPTPSPFAYTLGPLTLYTKKAAELQYQESTLWDVLIDAVVGSGTYIWGDTVANGNMEFRTFTETSTLSTSGSTVATDAQDIIWAKIVAAPTRNEKFAAHLKATGRLDVLTCTNTCKLAADWTLRATAKNNTTDVNAENMRAFDVAYEQISGRAMIVFSSGAITGSAYYCLWDGTNWSPSPACGATVVTDSTNKIDLSTVGVSGQAEWVRLVPHGDRLTSYRDNQMLLGISDSNDDMFTAHWTGSAWDNFKNPVDDLTTTDAQKFDLTFEELSGLWMSVFTDQADQAMRYLTGSLATGWNNTIATNGPTNPFTDPWNGWLELASDPTANGIAMIGSLSRPDADNAVWTGAHVWVNGTVDLTDQEEVGGKNVGVAFERFTSRATFYNVGSADLDIDGHCWTESAGFGSLNTAIGTWTTGDDIQDLIAIPSPNTNGMMGAASDIDDTLEGWVYTAATGCADGDWVNTSVELLQPIGVDGALNVNSIRLPYYAAYSPYSPWTLNWRFFDDETVNDPTTGLNGAAENAAPTGVDQEEFIRLRMNTVERGGVMETDTRKILQYTTKCNPNYSAADCTWTNVGDTGETSSVWRYATAAETCTACADGGTSTTSRLTGTNQITPAVIYVSDKDAAQDTDFDHRGLKVLEIDFPLKAESVAPGATYYFRLYEPRISSAGQESAIFPEMDIDGNNDCASSTCTYPSLAITGTAEEMITGTVYTDEGVSPLANATVAVSLNGGTATDTDFTDYGGQFTVYGLATTGGSILNLYIDGSPPSRKAVTVTLGSGTTMTGVHLYRDHLIVRSDSGSVGMSNTTLAIADNNADTDITSIYTIATGNAVTVKQGKSLFVWVGDTYVPGGSVTVGSGVLIQGTFRAERNPLILSGSFVNTGTFTAGSGTVLFDAMVGSRTIKSNSSSFHHLLMSGSTTLLRDALDVNGNLTLSGGTLDVTSGNYGITLSGSWLKKTGATFTAQNGTVTLDGGTQTMSGSNTFFNLTKTVTTAKTLTFAATAQQIITNALTLRGSVGTLLSLRSSVTNLAAKMRLQTGGAQTIDYLNVQDNDASGGETLVCYLTAEGCVNSGNNTNWNFTDPVAGNVTTQFFFLGF